MMMTSRMWIALLAGLLASMLLTPAPATAAYFAVVQETEDEMLDRVTLASGRQFTGRIIEEADGHVTMEILHMGMRATQTWSRADILAIDYQVVAAPTATTPDRAAPSRGSDAVEPDDHRRVVYKMPISGWVGFDSHLRVLQMLWREALSVGAQTVVLEFDCMAPLDGNIEEYREFFKGLKLEARRKEIELVAVIREAIGVGVAYALMFEDIYFYPDGFMGGGKEYINDPLVQMFTDEAVRAKMISAWVGICRGMAEEGGHSADLCEAMIRPEAELYARLEGDRGIFRGNVRDPEGWEVLANDPERELQFRAGLADRYAVSRGTVHTIDDLMNLRRHHEYRFHEGNAERTVERWQDGWRDAVMEVFQIRIDMDVIDSLDIPPDQKIARKINEVRKIQDLVRRWPPLEPFFPPENLHLELDTLRKELRNIRRR